MIVERRGTQNDGSFVTFDSFAVAEAVPAPFASPSAPGASLLLTAAFCFNPRVLLEEELPSDKAIRILVHVSFGLLLNWK